MLSKSKYSNILLEDSNLHHYIEKCLKDFKINARKIIVESSLVKFYHHL